VGFRFGLGRARKRPVATGSLLLNDVREFVREQTLSRRTVRPIEPRCEGDVVPDGVCVRIHRRRRLGSMGVTMDPHAAEVMAKAMLHEPPGFSVERSSG
jgi:hypothetical protein